MDNVLRMSGRYLTYDRISEFLGSHKRIKITNPYGQTKEGEFISMNDTILLLRVNDEYFVFPLLEVVRVEKIN